MKRNAVSLYDWCLANGQQTILEQWDSARNVGVSPRTIAYGSNKPVYWICSKVQMSITFFTGTVSSFFRSMVRSFF